MASQTLRPLSIGEILDAGIKVLTRHWKVLIVCVAGLVFPMRVVQVLLLASIDPDGLDAGFGTSTDSTDADFGPALVGYGVSLLLSGLVFLVAFAACFKAVSDAWLGAPPEVGRSLRFGLRRLVAMVGAYIVWVVGLIVGFILLIVPGVYLSVAWSLTLPALLFENTGIFAAFGRSRTLVRGRWWPTLALVAVGYLLVSFLGGVLEALLVGLAGVSSDSVVPDAIATVIGGTITSAITTPYLAAVLTILYFDQRVRKEGFDLQLMAESLGQPHDPDAPIPAPLVGEDLTPEQRAAAPYWPPPPGWTPPPAPAPPAHSGWEPPAAEREPTLWRGDGSPAAPPGDATEAPPAAAGAASPPEDDRAGSDRPGAAAASPPEDGRPASDRPPAAGASRPEDDRAASDGPAAEPQDEPAKRDPGRADWLPPEAPRGPGGL